MRERAWWARLLVRPSGHGVTGLLLPNHFPPHVLPQHLGHHDAPVGLLVVLDHRDQPATDRDGGAVEGVDEVRALFALLAVADVEAAGLVVGAVARAGDLAVFARLAAAGHPGLEVELAIGGAA